MKICSINSSSSRRVAPLSATRLLAALLAALLLPACATIEAPEQSGFLSDYSKLEQQEGGEWFYGTGEARNYTKFHLEPMVMLFKPDEAEPEFTPEELEELTSYMTERLTLHLTEDDGYEVVSGPGPGVASFRIAITDIEATIGALNVVIYTKITGAGLGGVAAEGELVDSVSRRQIAAAIRFGSGSRVLRAGFTRLGDAKLVLDRWAKQARASIDRAHGRL